MVERILTSPWFSEFLNNRRILAQWRVAFGLSSSGFPPQYRSWACGFFGREERPIWRTQAENACFARSLVTPSATIVPSQEIDGPGICGMTRPLKVSALANGTIAVDKVLTIDCPMIPAHGSLAQRHRRA